MQRNQAAQVLCLFFSKAQLQLLPLCFCLLDWYSDHRIQLNRKCILVKSFLRHQILSRNTGSGTENMIFAPDQIF